MTLLRIPPPLIFFALGVHRADMAAEDNNRQNSIHMTGLDIFTEGSDLVHQIIDDDLTTARWRDDQGNPIDAALGDYAVQAMEDVEVIHDETDLPDLNDSGEHPLQDDTVYRFDGFVTAMAPLRLGDPSPLIGLHGAQDGFIYMGGSGAAIRGDNDGGLFMRDMYAHAPDATMYDITAATDTEMLVESISHSDAAGLGNISDLGAIDGFRVPTWKGCNFEDFDSGLTFDGDPNKIFISDSPLRGVTESNVDIFTLASTCGVDIVDFPNNYVKSVQSDTTVWNLETIPNDVLQYRGTTHDSTVTKSNVISGTAATNGRDTVGVMVSESFPLEDSVVSGDLTLDSAVTISESTGSTTQIIAGNTSGGSLSTTLFNAKRVSKPADGKIQYDAKDDRVVRVFLELTLSASNTTLSIFIGKNDNDIERSQRLVESGGTGSPVTVSSTVNMEMTAGDTVSGFVRDDDGTTDIEIEAMSMTLGPQ
jgi:hypothetical protein